MLSTKTPQSWVTKPMQSIGYRSNPGGVCYGFAFMAMHTILLQEILKFNDRLREILQSQDTFSKRLTDMHQLRKLAYDEARLDTIRALFGDAATFDESSISKRDREQLEQGIQEKLKKALKKFKNEERTLLDILIFFEGIELYFQAYLYPHLFSEGDRPLYQNGQKTLPLLLPEALEKQGGVVKADQFSSAYTYEDLQYYFQSLRQKLTSCNFEHPVSLVLHATHHAINVGYDPINNRWIFVDANKPPAVFVDSDIEIAKQVLSSLAKNMQAVFTTEIYVAGNNHQDFKSVLTAWKDEKEWQDMHEITLKKADMHDSRNGSLLLIAVQSGDVKLVESLLKIGADPNHAEKEGATPLCVAAQNGQLEILNLLIKHGADLNRQANNGVSCLHLAAQNGHVGIVKTLLEQNIIDVDKGDNADATPLFYAAQNNHLAIVELLLTAKADVNKARGEVTPLLMAAQKNNTDIVSKLIAAGAKLDDTLSASFPILMNFADKNKRKREVGKVIKKYLRCKDKLPDKLPGFSALHLAVFFGHIESVNLLLEAGFYPKEKTSSVTLLELAQAMNHTQIATVLIKKTMMEQSKLSNNKSALFTLNANDSEITPVYEQGIECVAGM